MAKTTQNKVERIVEHLQITKKIDEFVEAIKEIDTEKPQLKLFTVFKHRGGYGCKSVAQPTLAQQLHASPGWIQYREEKIVAQYYDICTRYRIPPLEIY